MTVLYRKLQRKAKGVSVFPTAAEWLRLMKNAQDNGHCCEEFPRGRVLLAVIELLPKGQLVVLALLVIYVIDKRRAFDKVKQHQGQLRTDGNERLGLTSDSRARVRTRLCTTFVSVHPNCADGAYDATVRTAATMPRYATHPVVLSSHSVLGFLGAISAQY